MIKIGIIGGSGLDDPQIIENPTELDIETPYGSPSSPLTVGKIAGVDVAILARHGKTHALPPTEVPYRANIDALRAAGCTHILATTAVGSLREEIERGDLVIIDQFIDFTRHRTITFHEEFASGPVHTPMADPFDESLRGMLLSSAAELGVKAHNKGTVVTIEGPRFSTRAESHMFRSWGADIINMSIAPEAILANEAGIPYAAVAMSTDYDCWKEDEEPVTWEQILEIFGRNAENVKNLLLTTIPKIAAAAEPGAGDAALQDEIKGMIRTIPHFPIEGVMFRDITTLIKNPNGLRLVTKALVERYKDSGLDAVAGMESRGFVVGSTLAHELGIGFIMLRKPGKLPGKTEKVEYTTEYSTDAIEVHSDAITPGLNVLVIDDLIATGGTALAACQLVEKLGGTVHECAFVVDLPDLAGKKKLTDAGYAAFNLIEFEGE
jgi:5'-methylthioadenosine phosphorylase